MQTVTWNIESQFCPLIYLRRRENNARIKSQYMQSVGKLLISKTHKKGNLFFTILDN